MNSVARLAGFPAFGMLAFWLFMASSSLSPHRSVFAVHLLKRNLGARAATKTALESPRWCSSRWRSHPELL
jgi:hypothetical protein